MRRIIVRSEEKGRRRIAIRSGKKGRRHIGEESW
jgi:hypothetical protein